MADNNLPQQPIQDIFLPKTKKIYQVLKIIGLIIGSIISLFCTFIIIVLLNQQLYSRNFSFADINGFNTALLFIFSCLTAILLLKFLLFIFKIRDVKLFHLIIFVFILFFAIFADVLFVSFNYGLPDLVIIINLFGLPVLLLFVTFIILHKLIKKSIVKSILITDAFIILLLLILFGAKYVAVFVLSSRLEKGPYNLDIISKIKSQDPTFPIMSWNTKKYGRIYASVGSPPTPMYACSNMVDAGVSFYNAKGEYIGNCGSPWGEEINFPYDCAYLEDLTYAKADYKSDICEINETGEHNIDRVIIDLKDNLQNYNAIPSKYVVIDNKVYFSSKPDIVGYDKSMSTNKLIPEANAEKFVAIDQKLGKDDKNIYYAVYDYKNNKWNIKIFSEADTATFVDFVKTHDIRYFKDVSHVYALITKSQIIPGNSSFEHLSDENLLLVENADIATFKILTNRYSRDKERIYFDSVVIKDADPATFEVPNDTNDYFKIKNYYERIDKTYTGSDYDLIENLARDKNFYFQQGIKIPDINSKSNIYLFFDTGFTVSQFDFRGIVLRQGDLYYWIYGPDGMLKNDTTIEWGSEFKTDSQKYILAQ